MNNLFEQIYRESVYEDVEDNKELRGLFDKYNKECFDNELFLEKICWARRRTTARLGAFFPGLSYIVLNPILKEHINEPLFKDVLIHEMIHCKLEGIDSGHGKYFLEEADKLNKNFDLHITATADDGSDLGKILGDYAKEREDKRNEKLNNISNKPELQETFDRLNKDYFNNEITNDLTIEYLPKKTWNLYSLGQQCRNEDEWIWYIKVNREKVEGSIMNAMLYIYCYDVLKAPKKEINNKFAELKNAFAEKFNLDYLKN